MTEANTDSERESIDIALGEGAIIDGGPYENVEIESVRYDESTDAVVVLASDDVATHETRVSNIQQALRDEAESGEPIIVSGVNPDDAEASITLPLVDGMDVRAGGHLMTAEAIRLGNVPREFIAAIENDAVKYFPQ